MKLAASYNRSPIKFLVKVEPKKEIIVHLSESGLVEEAFLQEDLRTEVVKI